MTDEAMQELLKTSDRLVGRVSVDFHRYLQIDWSDRLICLMGARGTGKTTMLRQRMKESFGVGSDKAVYISLDDLWFSQYRVKDAVEYLDSHGFTHVFIDEVHQIGKDWSLLIKNLYDQFPDMNFIYSGSSMLKLENAKGDLSRRQAVYRLKGLSFREYLKFEGIADLPVLTLGEILENHRRIAAEITSGIKVLLHFGNYLRSGFYPFYKESHSQYRERLLETVNKVLESDYPAVEDVTPATIRKTKKMLMVLAASCPQQPNMSALYRELETDRNQGLKMLSVLERAGLLALVPSGKDTLKNLSRPEKIFCDNPNIMHALVSRANEGTIRETFFVNQLRSAGHEVVCAEKGDFLVDGRHLLEVGGAGKGFSQIKDVPNSFVAADDVETGYGNKIPLWLFGFLY